MGGMGSGRYSYGKRDTTEDCREIDVRRWQREGLLTAGRGFNWQWSSRGEVRAQIGVRVEYSAIRLIYRARRYGEDWQDVDARVMLTYTGCNYGGQRVWFVCPGCGRRAAKLYAGGIHYACRHCYCLPYASQGETARDRQIRKADKIRERLKGEAGILNSLPCKPKGMHHKTYQRLRWKLVRAQEIALQSLWFAMERLIR